MSPTLGALHLEARRMPTATLPKPKLTRDRRQAGVPRWVDGSAHHGLEIDGHVGRHLETRCRWIEDRELIADVFVSFETVTSGRATPMWPPTIFVGVGGVGACAVASVVSGAARPGKIASARKRGCRLRDPGDDGSRPDASRMPAVCWLSGAPGSERGSEAVRVRIVRGGQGRVTRVERVESKRSTSAGTRRDRASKAPGTAMSTTRTGRTFQFTSRSQATRHEHAGDDSR